MGMRRFDLNTVAAQAVLIGSVVARVRSGAGRRRPINALSQNLPDELWAAWQSTSCYEANQRRT